MTIYHTNKSNEVQFFTHPIEEAFENSIYVSNTSITSLNVSKTSSKRIEDLDELSIQILGLDAIYQR